MSDHCRCGLPHAGWPGPDGTQLCQYCWEDQCSLPSPDYTSARADFERGVYDRCEAEDRAEAEYEELKDWADTGAARCPPRE